MYALELKDRSRRNRWIRYAVCRKYSILELVRLGQEYPERWRVVRLAEAAPLLSTKSA